MEKGELNQSDDFAGKWEAREAANDNKPKQEVKAYYLYIEPNQSCSYS